MHYHVNVPMPYIIIFKFENDDMCITHIANESVGLYNTQGYKN